MHVIINFGTLINAHHVIFYIQLNSIVHQVYTQDTIRLNTHHI